MKKLVLAFSILFAFGLKAQMPNCSMMCVLSITLDTANSEMEVLFYNGDTLPINYPTVQVIDQNGDTVGNPAGVFNLFQQGQGVVLHEIPTTLTVLPQPFVCTVLMTDQIQDSTCILQYPMNCPMNIIDPGAHATFSVYPNPATDLLTIALPSNHSGKTQVSVTNVLGEVFSGTLMASNGKIELNVADLACGMYFVTVTLGEERYVQRVVRQ
jgi:hypothetical protein